MLVFCFDDTIIHYLMIMVLHYLLQFAVVVYVARFRQDVNESDREEYTSTERVGDAEHFLVRVTALNLHGSKAGEHGDRQDDDDEETFPDSRSVSHSISLY